MTDKGQGAAGGSVGAALVARWAERGWAVRGEMARNIDEAIREARAIPAGDEHAQCRATIDHLEGEVARLAGAAPAGPQPGQARSRDELARDVADLLGEAMTRNAHFQVVDFLRGALANEPAAPTCPQDDPVEVLRFIRAKIVAAPISGGDSWSWLPRIDAALSHARYHGEGAEPPAPARQPAPAVDSTEAIMQELADMPMDEFTRVMDSARERLAGAVPPLPDPPAVDAARARWIADRLATADGIVDGFEYERICKEGAAVIVALLAGLRAARPERAVVERLVDSYASKVRDSQFARDVEPVRASIITAADVGEYEAREALLDAVCGPAPEREGEPR